MTTETPEIIPITSRYGDDYSLILVGDNVYRTDFGDNTVVRVGLWGEHEHKEGYCFIDPPGGPFIAVGDTLHNKTVKSIKDGDKCFLIEFFG